MAGFNEKIVAEHSKPRRTLAERVRRGACLLNAAQYDEAIVELGAGLAIHSNPLQFYLASCAFDGQCAGSKRATMESLREAIAEDSENAQLHFLLGALLVEQGRMEEAELRFTQAVSISREHVEALVCLALCHRLRGEIRQGISLLQRAQAMRPNDAKIALFLAQAAKLGSEQGAAIDLCAVVTND